MSLTLGLVAILGTAAPRADPASHAKNLQVMPRATSDAQVDRVMKILNRAPGVECDFCHVKDDWANDDHPMKIRVRKAMKDLKEWNEKHNPGDEPKATCFKCQEGKRIPDYQRTLNEVDPAAGLASMLYLTGGDDVDLWEALSVVASHGKPKPPPWVAPVTPSPETSGAQGKGAEGRPVEPGR